MFIITNETKTYLSNTGVWVHRKSEAMWFGSAIEAQEMVDNISAILPAFTDLFPEVVSLT